MSSPEPEPASPMPTAAAVARKGWQWGLGPHYIGLFLWIAYLDPLPARSLAIGGLPAAVSGAAIGGMLCLLMFYAPAMWGFRSGRALWEAAESTFGRRGARWLPGLVLALVQVGWFAVAVEFGLSLTLQGLEALGLLDASTFGHRDAGGWMAHGPLFNASAVLWTLWTALIAAWFVRVIAALMNIYPAFPALALGAAMLWAAPGLPGFQPWGIDPRTARFVVGPEMAAAALVVQLMLSFFATAAAGSVDWGAASQTASDVRLGGLVGVAFTAFLLATLGLTTVAGAHGRQPPAPGLAADDEAQADLARIRAMKPGGGPLVEKARGDVIALGGSTYTLSAVFRLGIGGRWGGAALLLFGLGSMAPAVYAASTFGYRFAALGPRVPRWLWTVLGAWASVPLIAVLGGSVRREDLYGLLGGLAAPVVGAVAADAFRRKGRWPGPRRGVNAAGVLAWLAGAAVGFLPAAGRLIGRDLWPTLFPATFAAYLAAFVAFVLLSLIGLEPRPAAENTLSPSPSPPAPDPAAA